MLSYLHVKPACLQYNKTTKLKPNWDKGLKNENEILEL